MVVFALKVQSPSIKQLAIAIIFHLIVSISISCLLIATNQPKTSPISHSPLKPPPDLCLAPSQFIAAQHPKSVRKCLLR